MNTTEDSPDEDVRPASPRIILRAVRAKFLGSGLVYRDALTTRGSLALVPENFMVKPQAADPSLMWLDGKAHPKVGILCPPQSWFDSNVPEPVTGKRLKSWQPTEPWNREKAGHGDKLQVAHEFWEWLESSTLNQPADLTDLTLLGRDYATLGDVSYLGGAGDGPREEADNAPGSRSWTNSYLGGRSSQPTSFLHNRLLSSIVLLEGSAAEASAVIAQHFVPSSQLAVQGPKYGISEVSLGKRTLIEMGTAGLLRETDGDGGWFALETEASTSDGDSEIAREIRSDLNLLKRQELATNLQIAALRKRVESNEAFFVPSKDAPGAETRVLQWQKVQRRKIIMLQKRFEQKIGVGEDGFE